jgi:membrane peptidoglycan carboxypeptidase
MDSRHLAVRRTTGSPVNALARLTLNGVRRPSLTQSISLLLAVSIVAGVLVAGMLLPFVGGVGLVARNASDSFTVPAILKRKPLPQVSHVLAADGTPIASFYDQYRKSVPLAKIPLVMQRAMIDTEDVRYYEHEGLDIRAALRALFTNGSSGGVSQGGSTIPQQYVKNVLIENARTKSQRAAATADTLARKIKEARYAIYLEKHYSKAQILDWYFNIVYFGDGAYGIGAAAKHYFDEPVTKLNLAQSALLAGLVQSPEAYNPRYYPVAAKQRRDTVLGQMLKYHSIDQPTYDAAIAKPIRLHIHNQGNDCIASKYPYFCDYVKHVFETTPGLSLSMLRRKGLTITTTLDPQMQKAATAGIHQYVYAHEPSHVAGAEALVEPGTGQVKALAVNTKYGNDPKKGENSINYAVDRKYGGSPGFHAGSTFKLFVLAAALKEGIPLSTRISAPSTITITGLTNCAGAPVAPWPVHNAGDGESGTFNLESGTWFSVNTFFAQLEKRTGLCEPVKLAEAMGVSQGTGKPPEQVGPFVLGGGARYGFTPLDLAGAYATMAAHGKYCSPIVITKIVDPRSGTTYPVPKSHCEQVVPEGLANTVTAILQGVLTKPGATGIGLALTGRPAAAKTGTLDNNTGSWFAGYTPQLASAVWVGIPKAPNKSLNYLRIGPTSYSSVYGATIAGPIWRATMNAALQGAPVVQFTGPSSYYEIGITTAVPDVTGDSPGDAMATLKSAGFDPQIVPGTVHSAESLGTVARTSPPAGSRASSGAVIQIYISDGTPAPVKTHSQQPGGGHSSSPASPPASGKPSPTPTKTGHH